jgi:hypothetical protein
MKVRYQELMDRLGQLIGWTRYLPKHCPGCDLTFFVEEQLLDKAKDKKWTKPTLVTEKQYNKAVESFSRGLYVGHLVGQYTRESARAADSKLR